MQWLGNSSGGESKCCYYIWIDVNGNVQNSFYVGVQVVGQCVDYVLFNGEYFVEYIDVEVFEGKGFVCSENGSFYYIWVDEKGCMYNLQILFEECVVCFKWEVVFLLQIVFIEGWQIEFKQYLVVLFGLDGVGQQSDVLKVLFKGIEMIIDDFYQDL